LENTLRTRTDFYTEINYALDLFEQGLSQLKNGETPHTQITSELNKTANEVFDGLGSTFRKLYPLDIHIIHPGVNKKNFYRKVWIEYVETILCLISIHQAVDRAIEVLDYFRHLYDWKTAFNIVEWVKVLHPQLGAVIALELSGMMRLQCIENKKLLEMLINFKQSKSISLSIKNLLSLEIKFIKSANPKQSAPKIKPIAWKIERMKMKVNFRICDLTTGPANQIIIGGFQLDYSHGGIAFADPITGKTTPVHEDIAARSLFYDQSSEKLYVAAFQGKECRNTHIAVINVCGEIEQIIDLCSLSKKKNIQAWYIQKISDFIYFIDDANSTIYELHLSSLTLKAILKNNITGKHPRGMTVQGNDLLIFISGKSGYIRYTPNQGQQLSQEGENIPGQIIALCCDNESGYTYTMGNETSIFEQSVMYKPGRIIILNQLDHEGNIIFCQHLHSEYCMDMILSSYAHNRYLLLPSSTNSIMSICLPKAF